MMPELTDGAVIATDWKLRPLLADPHLGVKLERASKHHNDVGSLDLGEAGQLEPNGVAAGHEIRRLKLTVGVGHERPDRAALGVGRDDRYPRDGGALLVRHTASQPADTLLSGCEARQDQRTRQEEGTNTCVHQLSLLDKLVALLTKQNRYGKDVPDWPTN